MLVMFPSLWVEYGKSSRNIFRHLSRNTDWDKVHQLLISVTGHKESTEFFFLCFVKVDVYYDFMDRGNEGSYVYEHSKEGVVTK